MKIFSKKHTIFLAIFVVQILFFGFSKTTHAAAWIFQVIDTFDDANSLADYGLNDRLQERSLFLHAPASPATWSRRAGTWFDKTILREWLAQVNHPVHPGTLSFHNEINAVCKTMRIDSGPQGVYRIKAKVSPIVGDSAGSPHGNWASIMFDGSSTKKGYVTETDIGFTIRSNGNFQIYQLGAMIYSNNAPFRSTYDVTIEIKEGVIRGMVDDTPFQATLPNPIPRSGYLYLGAYLEMGQISTFDDVMVQTRSGAGANHLKKYGYYWTEGFPGSGNHLPEVSAYTNFNFIQPGLPYAPSLSALPLCIPKKCVLQVRWEFWPAGSLDSDWKKRWNSTFEDIKRNKDKISALYITDEPFWSGVLWSDYVTVLAQVRSDLDAAGMVDVPIMAAFSEPEITRTGTYPSINVPNLNLAGFDHYQRLVDFNNVKTVFSKLKARVPGRPYFLVPQSFIHPGSSDAEIAALNWAYYLLAAQDGSVVGLMNFGLWTHSQPSELTYTLQVQKLIGKMILEP